MGENQWIHTKWERAITFEAIEGFSTTEALGESTGEETDLIVRGFRRWKYEEEEEKEGNLPREKDAEKGEKKSKEVAEDAMEWKRQQI